MTVQDGEDHKAYYLFMRYMKKKFDLLGLLLVIAVTTATSFEDITADTANLNSYVVKPVILKHQVITT